MLVPTERSSHKEYSVETSKHRSTMHLLFKGYVISKVKFSDRITELWNRMSDSTKIHAS